MVVPAFEGSSVLRPQALDDLDRFLEARDAQAGTIVADARLDVVALHPAGANPEFVAAAREQLNRRRLLGEHDRVAEVHVVDQRAHAQVLGHRARGPEQRRRIPLIAEVVRNEHARKAEVLNRSQLFGPLRAVQFRELDAKSKGLAHVLLQEFRWRLGG